MVRLAKLILHFNTPELTENLCRMVPGAIVIDNGSTKYPYTGKNRCIRQGNFGFTKGWNAGIKAVYKEFDAFWLMNSDIKPWGDCVAQVEKLLNHNPAVQFFTPAYNCWMKHCQPQNQVGSRSIQSQLVETNVMEFTAPVIRKKVFEKIGFFDELFAKGYGVEFDFCYRARKAGIQMHVDHRMTFYHLGQQTINQHEGILAYSNEANAELTTGLRAKYGPDYKRLVMNGLKIKTDLEMKIAIYTTIFGDYDTLKEMPTQEVGADLFVITDKPLLNPPQRGGLKEWNVIVPEFPRKDLHPRMRAKFFKLFPWEIEQLKKYDITIYIDASIRITSGNFVATCVKNLTNGFLLFKHPQRNCIYQEGDASLSLIKYQSEPIKEQLDFYRRFHPANSGLYACGIMIRKNTELVRKIMGDWWWEIMKYSYQDQLSLPVVLRANKFTPSTFAENQYKNGFLRVEWHDDKSPTQTLPEGEGLKKDEPFFTVLMPVWKTPVDLLRKAIVSIVNQYFRDFELVIVDDNNQDEELVKVLNGFDDGIRVRVIRTTENKGLAATLDFGIGQAKGKYIVRMDSDDVAHKDLLQKHYDHIQNNPDTVLCGVQLNLMKDGKLSRITNHPKTIDRNRAATVKSFWLVNHPGVCYKRDVVLELGGYGDTPPQLAEDYALWCKFLNAGYVIENLPDVLIDYRLGDGSQIGQNRKGDEWVIWLEKWKKSLNH